MGCPYSEHNGISMVKLSWGTGTQCGLVYLRSNDEHHYREVMEVAYECCLGVLFFYYVYGPGTVLFVERLYGELVISYKVR